MLRLSKIARVSRIPVRTSRLRTRECQFWSSPRPPDLPKTSEEEHKIHHRWDELAQRVQQLSRKEWARTILILLATLGFGGALLWAMFGKDVKKKASEDATAAVKATIASAEVTQQVQTLSKDVVESVLTSEQTQQWTSRFSKAVVADLIADPQTTQQVARLLQRAVLQPDSTQALLELLRDLLKQEGTTQLVNDLAARTVHTVLDDPSIREHAVKWVQSVLHDEEIHKHGGDAIWCSVTAALTPSFMQKKKEKEAAAVSVADGLHVLSLDTQPGEVSKFLEDLASGKTPQAEEPAATPSEGGGVLTKVRSWFGYGKTEVAAAERSQPEEARPSNEASNAQREQVSPHAPVSLQETVESVYMVDTLKLSAAELQEDAPPPATEPAAATAAVVSVVDSATATSLATAASLTSSGASSSSSSSSSSSTSAFTAAIADSTDTTTSSPSSSASANLPSLSSSASSPVNVSKSAHVESISATELVGDSIPTTTPATTSTKGSLSYAAARSSEYISAETNTPTH